MNPPSPSHPTAAVATAAARRVRCALALALAAGALLAASCGGSDTEAYPAKNCCVGTALYVCSTATAAGRCLTDPQDPTACSLQTGVTCSAATSR